MQVLFLPEPWTLISYFLVWLVIQLGVSLLGLLIPGRWLRHDRGMFRQARWESSAFYKRRLKVHLWKKFLPDGAATTKSGFRKKSLDGSSPEYLEKFLVESCRAELVHWVAILPFWVFGFWAPAVVIAPMFAYALIVNLPCIITQRYNRPRFAALLGKTLAARIKSDPGG
jgi:glycosyl-4,4'-diaponeurosporenoate acyltransferase